jgi:hypothetical protein
MVACETCWNDAYRRSRMFGGTQVEHYENLLWERSKDATHVEFNVPSVDPDLPTTRPTPPAERGES